MPSRFRPKRSPPAERTVGWVIYARRRELDWGQQELATRAGMGQSRINTIENNPTTKVRADTAVRLADSLEIDMKSMLRGELVRLKDRTDQSVAASVERGMRRMTLEQKERVLAYVQGILDADRKPNGGDK